MIVQRLKGNKLVAYNGEINEIESFSLLILNEEEWENLYKLSTEWIHENNKYILTYEYKDSVSKYYNLLCMTHKELNPLFTDVAEKYEPKVTGTSMLIRDVKNHVIRIAFRKGNTCDLNKLFIGNNIREEFFRDTKKCSYLYKTGIYAIDSSDEGYYRKWSNYMNDKYLKAVKE